MPKITPNSLSLHIDGKSVDVLSDHTKTFELNKALTNPGTFKEFANDPKTAAAKYGINIDPTISAQLKGKLAGVNSLHDHAAIHTAGGAGATVWAIASGAYSISSTKIAVVV